MTDNPLDDSDAARNARIEKRAYHLWEADGRPHGQHDEFWERASELVRMEEAAGFGQLPNPATVPGADPLRVQPVEEAFIQDNLGEFPDRSSDQGERPQTPRAGLRHEAAASSEGAANASKSPKGKDEVRAGVVKATSSAVEKPRAAKPDAPKSKAAKVDGAKPGSAAHKAAGKATKGKTAG